MNTYELVHDGKRNAEKTTLYDTYKNGELWLCDTNYSESHNAVFAVIEDNDIYKEKWCSDTHCSITMLKESRVLMKDLYSAKCENSPKGENPFYKVKGLPKKGVSKDPFYDGKVNW